jgi:hypothetical protein
VTAVTRTLGPLHLEDLEPHRFEDLIRQLLYDFRPWQALESTGRSGSDDGFDARGWEVEMSAEEEQSAASDDEAAAEVNTAGPFRGRQWLIQCKREKVIGPSKVEAYLRGLPSAIDEELHGLIFVGACDFSKDTRDRFYAVARELGCEEAILWGKGEIEDQLFQPKNDHLLFAYFGVSLQIRRRSLRTSVRNRLSMKRKAKAALDTYTNVLIRSASDKRYPYLDQDESKARQARGNWEVLKVVGCFSNGVHLSHDRHLAMIDDNGRWDYAEHMNDGPVDYENPWITAIQQTKLDGYNRNRQAAMAIWDGLPEVQRAWFTRDLVLPYENIIDIDKEGDEFFAHPHVYADWVSETMGPFREFYAFSLETISQWSPRQASCDDDARIEVFSRNPVTGEDAT